jgi:hypothetical protein
MYKYRKQKKYLEDTFGLRKEHDRSEKYLRWAEKHFSEARIFFSELTFSSAFCH